MGKQYQVGQILYVVSSKAQKVLPCQVSEEVERKTLQGSTISYKVIFGSKEPQVLELEKIDGEIFTSPEEVRRVLIERASKVISKMVETATTRAKEWYISVPNMPRANPVETRLDLAEIPDDEFVTEADAYTSATSGNDNVLELPDGRMAKVNVKMPADLSVPTRKS
jgi:hypothetical protein